MILTVTLNPAVDRTIRIESFSADSVIPVKHSSASAGGKGINAARVLKKLGAGVKAAGLLGGAAGRLVTEYLRGEAIDSAFTGISGETRHNITLISEKTGAETHLVETGPAVTEKESGEFIKDFQRMLNGGGFRCAVFSGSVPPGMPEDIYAVLITKCREANVKAALDSRGAPLRSGVQAGPDFFKPNEDELEEIADGRLKSDADRAEFALSLGIPEVLASMGGRGMVLAAGGRAWRVSHPELSRARAVGAGDALFAGYLYSRIAMGEGYPESARMGASCALAHCAREGRASPAGADMPGNGRRIEVRRIL